MADFIPLGIIKRMEGKKVKITSLKSRFYIEGILDYIDTKGNLHILTDSGEAEIVQADWGIVSTDMGIKKEEG